MDGFRTCSLGKYDPMPRLPRRLRGLGSALASTVIALAVLAPADAVDAKTPSVRLSGTDRFATAAAASRTAFAQPTAAVVYLASGADFADALSAAPAAAHEKGSLLLTSRTVLPRATSLELARLKPPRVVVVGGPGAISDGVLAAARQFSPAVVRVSGKDRYLTSEAVARYAFQPSVTDGVVIATGRDYPDALAAGPAAGALGRPLVVVDGRRTSVAATTGSLLRELGVHDVLVTGGSGVVSAGLSKSLAELVAQSGGSVVRASGADRYATAVALNRQAFPALSIGDAYVATGTGFPDALAVGVLAGMRRRPLYLSEPYCVPSDVRSALASPAIGRLVLVGGVGAVRGNVGRLTPCQSIGSASSPWVVVNKQRRLNPSRYAPSPLVKPSLTNINGQSLRSDAADAPVKMAAGSQASGSGRIAMLSGYRSYAYQSSVYAAKVASVGRTEADRWVARPGYSEHQTGLSADLTPVGAANCAAYTCIGVTTQGRWLAANSWRYGFVLRYEAGQVHVTGYHPEPWHFRYVGLEVARDYHDGGFHSLEAYFGLRPAPSY
jgi:LAS superfamily LD-carboxypeptidase LdcB/putative cell wall-binding protein